MTQTRRQIMKAGLLATAAVPVVGATTGCATLLEFLGEFVKPPDLSLKNFQVTKTTLSSFAVRLDAVLKNPNPFGFRIDGLDWGVRLAGGNVATGAARKGFTLKARGTSETPLELDFNIARTAAAIIELIEKRSVPLGINAVVHLRANKYRFDVPADYETRLPLPQLPAFAVPTFALRDASLSGLRFVVEPLVTNPNPFDLDIDAFDFDIKLGGRSVVRNRTVKNVKIESKQKKRVPFDFAVNLAEVGLTAASLAARPRLDWELVANLKSGLLDLPFRQGGRVAL
jgi:LEA14-like dessication related protein